METRHIGHRIEELRIAIGWTRPDLARETGLSISAIEKLESGKRKPSLETARLLAWALRVSLDAMVYGEDS